MIYLSWSLWGLVFILCLLVTLYVFGRRCHSRGKLGNLGYKVVNGFVIIATFSVCLSAFDVGDRQIVHNRVNYDLDVTNSVPSKKEVVVPTKELEHLCEYIIYLEEMLDESIKFI